MATAAVLEVPITTDVLETKVRADENLNNLAKKCIEIGKRIWDYNREAAEFEHSFFSGESFKKWFSKNVKYVVALRSTFPSVQTPGSHKKLTLTLECVNLDPKGPQRIVETREYTWEEFIALHMSITPQYLNRLLDEFAPEAKPPKPPKAKKTYTTHDGLPSDLIKREKVLKQQVKELAKKASDQEAKLETYRKVAAEVTDPLVVIPDNYADSPHIVKAAVQKALTDWAIKNNMPGKFVVAYYT